MKIDSNNTTVNERIGPNNTTLYDRNRSVTGGHYREQASVGDECRRIVDWHVFEHHLCVLKDHLL